MEISEKINLNKIVLSKGNITISVYEKYKEEKEKEISLDKVNDFDLKGIEDSNGSIEFYSNPKSGFYKLRLKEIKEYHIKLNPKNLVLNSNFIEKIDEDSYKLKIINYLGKSRFDIKESDGINHYIDFEIVPDKIDYEKDYVKLTEDIADYCSALLLDYASPTSLTFTDDTTKQQRTPLESFIFLRKFCSNDNIETIFSNIKNNPDAKFVSEEEMKPFGTAPISKKIFSNPFRNAKMWDRSNYIPYFANTTRKYDSFDTIANKFIKFAFNNFISICDVVINQLEEKKSLIEYKNEALLLKEKIENILSDSFFTDIQDLQQLPNNNQVLQKREGYYQVYSAFAMLDLAKQLNWEGQDKVYEGEAKNTALLYEYWLVFQIIDILKEIGGKTHIGTEINDILQKNKDGNLLINLKEGTESKISFNIESRGIMIDFYYNRTFSATKFNNSIYKNSYSRPFRPDYTLAIYPSYYKEESKAIKDGLVSFVHFDAKYRVTDIDKLFGKENIKGKELEEEFNKEKEDSSINTYKRGDLLKMHTYNDAIRKTIGSYILYPGNKSEIHKIYDEILPGVGAFSIKPSDNVNSKNAIKNFILSIIDFNVQVSSKQYRKNYFENIVINTPTDSYVKEIDEYNKHTNPLNRIEEPIQQYGTNIYMIGFMRDSYLDKLKELGKIPKDKSTKLFDKNYFYFYYHAIEKDGFVQSIHKDINKANKFCAYDKNFKILNFEADIESIELIDRENLIKRIKEYGIEQEHNALYYYIVKLINIEYKEQTKTIDKINDFGRCGISPFTPIIKCL